MFYVLQKYPYPLTRDVSTYICTKKSKTGIQTFGGVHIKPGWLVQLVSCRHIFLLLCISCKSSRDYHFSTTWLIIPPRLHVHENKPLGIHITCTVLLYVYSNQSILLVLHTYRKVDQRAWLFNLEGKNTWSSSKKVWIKKKSELLLYLIPELFNQMHDLPFVLVHVCTSIQTFSFNLTTFHSFYLFEPTVEIYIWYLSRNIA